MVPLHSSIPISELADLAMIPETLLSRVIKFTATSGFLFEVQPDQIAHTTLSAKFVSDLSFFDAIMFVAESGAPTALQMAAATERKGKRKGSNDSAFSVAFNTSKTFQSACSEQPRLQRRYLAYTQYTGSKNDGFLELLGRLNWRSMGSACVVEVRGSEMLRKTNLLITCSTRRVRSPQKRPLHLTNGTQLYRSSYRPLSLQSLAMLVAILCNEEHLEWLKA